MTSYCRQPPNPIYLCFTPASLSPQVSVVQLQSSLSSPVWVEKLPCAMMKAKRLATMCSRSAKIAPFDSQMVPLVLGGLTQRGCSSIFQHCTLRGRSRLCIDRADTRPTRRENHMSCTSTLSRRGGSSEDGVRLDETTPLDHPPYAADRPPDLGSLLSSSSLFIAERCSDTNEQQWLEA
jgi:hypothetical protein